jgi:hypothetical protein
MARSYTRRYGIAAILVAQMTSVYRIHVPECVIALTWSAWIDMSPAAFSKIAELSTGELTVRWHFMSKGWQPWSPTSSFPHQTVTFFRVLRSCCIITSRLRVVLHRLQLHITRVFHFLSVVSSWLTVSVFCVLHSRPRSSGSWLVNLDLTRFNYELHLTGNEMLWC